MAERRAPPSLGKYAPPPTPKCPEVTVRRPGKVHTEWGKHKQSHTRACPRASLLGTGATHLGPQRLIARLTAGVELLRSNWGERCVVRGGGLGPGPQTPFESCAKRGIRVHLGPSPPPHDAKPRKKRTEDSRLANYKRKAMETQKGLFGDFTWTLGGFLGVFLQTRPSLGNVPPSVSQTCDPM